MSKHDKTIDIIEVIFIFFKHWGEFLIISVSFLEIVGDLRREFLSVV